MLIQSVSQRKTLWILPGAAYDIFQRGGGIFEELRAKHGKILYPPQAKNFPPPGFFLQ